MKKLLYLALLSLLFLSGCEKNTLRTPPPGLFAVEGNAAASGVGEGDGPEAFIEAYREYPVQVAYREQSSGYLTMSIEDIPYEDQISTIITGLFIDGEAVTEEEVSKENNIETSELPELLASPSYLRNHEVIYRLLDFHWEDSVIIDVSLVDLNYNETFDTPRVPA